MRFAVTNPKIDEWVKSELELFGINIPPNRLSASLQMAVLHLLASGLSNDLDEESFTGALLGAFCQTSRLATAGIPASSEASLTWRRHNKNGKDYLSERSTGADFSLIIRHDDDFAVAAVFQAKNGQSKIGSFDASHMSPEIPEQGRGKELQFCRIRDYCYEILAKFMPPKENKRGLNDLDWAHYLIYEPFAIYCSPLSSLSLIQDYIASDLKCGAVRYKEYSYSNFTDLLREGCTHGRAKRTGWLSLNSKDEISSFVASALDLFDVYESHVNPKPSWTPLIKDRVKIPVSERINEIRRALVRPLDNVKVEPPNFQTLEERRAGSTKGHQRAVGDSKGPKSPGSR
ncbi:hypothetical protein [Xanthomonas campestris]|uniref:hypothetical protein n=1 Tax=Xanthomonas campestris TaxID=339 RepID=UPI002B225D3C|nr:hypothetical protein [Xanthomonas campestris]MEA9705203.1 hypothetical protein [Xanthomonas campestris pv. raphani]